MDEYKIRPLEIDATQWFKNGDHPHDNSCPISPENPNLSEGEVVRRYRTPDLIGQNKCGHCDGIMHNHGWIDVPEDGRTVCPGDWIITGTDGEYYPCKPDFFALIARNWPSTQSL